MLQILGSAVSSKVAKSAHSKTLTRPGEFGKQKLRFKRRQNKSFAAYRWNILVVPVATFPFCKVSASVSNSRDT